MHDNSILSIRGLTKRYTGKAAVDHIDLEIPRGIIFGLLGPNGAGKTSLIRMITTITAPDEGSVHFAGEPLAEAHTRRIGYMPEERGLYRKMKVNEHLLYLLRLRGFSVQEAREKIRFWNNRLKVDDWAGKPISELSKGMQQKVQFIATVAHDPELLILDEPFSGLDPVNSKLIEDEILRLKSSGTSIIFSTHRMEQVEDMCDRIGLIDKGRLVLEDSVKQARRNYFRNEWLILYEGADKMPAIPRTETISDSEGKCILRLDAGVPSSGLLRELAETGIDIQKVEAHLPSLSEIFRMVIEGGNANG